MYAIITSARQVDGSEFVVCCTGRTIRHDRRVARGVCAHPDTILCDQSRAVSEHIHYGASAGDGRDWVELSHSKNRICNSLEKGKTNEIRKHENGVRQCLVERPLIPLHSARGPERASVRWLRPLRSD